MKAFIVRPKPEHKDRLQEFLEQDRIIIANAKGLLHATNKDEHIDKAGEGQAEHTYRFLNDISTGDYVVVPVPDTSCKQCYIAEVIRGPDVGEVRESNCDYYWIVQWLNNRELIEPNPELAAQMQHGAYGTTKDITDLLPKIQDLIR